jgi:hypothetical protein
MTVAKLALAAVACSVLAAASANAFTYDNRTNQDPTGLQKFRDSLGGNGHDGKSHFSFSVTGPNGGNGQGSYDNQTGVNSRFVPSANPAFSNPYYTPNNLDLALGNRH